MADKNIHEGDEVSWKWGTSEPTGTVAEIKTEGKLEIETKGKLIHKNADPSNPAVHVERSGNDVVKRASELTKLGSSTEGGQVDVSTTEKQQEGPGEEEDRQASKGQTKRARKKSSAAAITGEKRVATEAPGSADGNEEEAATKKTKTLKTHETNDGENKRPGQKHLAKREAGDIDPNTTPDEGITSAAKKTSRRKKSDATSKPPPTNTAQVDVDAPAANTRSKD